MPRLTPLGVLFFALATAGLGGCNNGTPVAEQSPPPTPGVVYTGTRVPWRAVLRQPAEWYGSDDARGLAVNVVGYQTDAGGWPKNLDMTIPPAQADRSADPGETLSNIDNDATYTQMVFLARVISAHDDPYLRAAFNRGLNYLLAAQYPNGGWPQYFPLRPGYYTRVTFNDNAMINTLTVLRDAANGQTPYAFVDAARRAQAAAAVAKGIQCILRSQILVNGQPTVWCAQYDEHTLTPAPARAYELASFSGQESVGITRFLMEVPHPSPEIVAAVQGAVAWFKAAQLTGAQVQALGGRAGNPNAVMWARFYDLDTMKPFFCGRDGVKKSNLQEIEAERRNGYAWFGMWPATLLNTDYPAWEQRLAALSTPPPS